MKVIHDYLRLVLFLGGAFIGVQVPSFVDLYGLRLESHLAESKISLNAFQQDANKYFNGDLQQLVRHYQQKSDPIIADGGNSIDAIIKRNSTLNDAFTRFNQNSLSRYLYSLYKPVQEIHNETLSAYDYSIKLNTIGITWALGLGFALSAAIEFLLLLMRILFKKTFRLSRLKPSKE